MSQGCIKWRGDLGAYVIGALDREERAAMRRHLAVCPACRADYEDLLHLRLAHYGTAGPARPGLPLCHRLGSPSRMEGPQFGD
jgi:anti-sigma factor RsiW